MHEWGKILFNVRLDFIPTQFFFIVYLWYISVISKYLNVSHLWRMNCLPWYDLCILVMTHTLKLFKSMLSKETLMGVLLYVFFLNLLKYCQVNFIFYAVISLVPLWQLVCLQYVYHYWGLHSVTPGIKLCHIKFMKWV